MTILFIEDDEDDVLLIEHACKKAGINEPKHFLSNGKRAVEFLGKEANVSSTAGLSDSLLIFLDLNMPEMSGFEFLDWLRSHSLLQTTPVIVLSTSDNPADIKNAYKLGANAYVIKPNAVTELGKMLAATHGFWLTYNQFDQR